MRAIPCLMALGAKINISIERLENGKVLGKKVGRLNAFEMSGKWTLK